MTLDTLLRAKPQAQAFQSALAVRSSDDAVTTARMVLVITSKVTAMPWLRATQNSPFSAASSMPRLAAAALSSVSYPRDLQ